MCEACGGRKRTQSGAWVGSVAASVVLVCVHACQRNRKMKGSAGLHGGDVSSAGEENANSVIMRHDTKKKKAL